MTNKVEYINPFISSVQDLFTTMLGSQASRKELQIAKMEGEDQITGLIGWSGPARGTIALVLPKATALNLANRLLGTDMKEITDDALDAVSETLNIIAGGAKAKFAEHEGLAGTIDLSLPTVIAGEDYEMQYPTETTWIEIPFESDLGNFSLRVAFEKVENGNEK